MIFVLIPGPDRALPCAFLPERVISIITHLCEVRENLPGNGRQL